MSLFRLTIFRVAALAGAGHLLLAAPLAQAGANDAVSAPADSAPVPPLVARSPAPPTPAPPSPLLRSPISFFRELLAMDAAGREQALTNRSPQARTLILAKVREYESLKPDERELRLRVTELRWYLRPLMSAPATNRPAQLAMIPEMHRELVRDRLQEWDKLSPELQKELLANEATIRYLTDIEGRTDEQRRQTLEAIPPAGRTVLQQGIDKWASMAEDQRQRMLNRFREFFELTAQEKRKVLNTLSGPERGQIERTLRGFDNLPPDQRDQCIRSLQKFAGLSPVERQQFLKSAERWKQMSPSERQVWRVLVRRLPPPLPPPLPPVRASLRPTPPVPPVATNRN
ncbi:MAG: DUF3106 domain-containing protein [Limisphaerales bacterium]